MMVNHLKINSSALIKRAIHAYNYTFPVSGHREPSEKKAKK
jgi:hypothetical protein